VVDVVVGEQDERDRSERLDAIKMRVDLRTRVDDNSRRGIYPADDAIVRAFEGRRQGFGARVRAVEGLQCSTGSMAVTASPPL
jgi:hypothetical protein